MSKNEADIEVATRMREILLTLQPFKLKGSGAKRVVFESPPNTITFDIALGVLTIENLLFPKEKSMVITEKELWAAAHRVESLKPSKKTLKSKLKLSKGKAIKVTPVDPGDVV